MLPDAIFSWLKSVSFRHKEGASKKLDALLGAMCLHMIVEENSKFEQILFSISAKTYRHSAILLSAFETKMSGLYLTKFKIYLLSCFHYSNFFALLKIQLSTLIFENYFLSSI